MNKKVCVCVTSCVLWWMSMEAQHSTDDARETEGCCRLSRVDRKHTYSVVCSWTALSVAKVLLSGLQRPRFLPLGLPS